MLYIDRTAVAARLVSVLATDHRLSDLHVKAAFTKAMHTIFAAAAGDVSAGNLVQTSEHRLEEMVQRVVDDPEPFIGALRRR